MSPVGGPHRNLRPQLLGTLAATIADVKRNDLTGFGVHRQPYPLLVRLLLHEASHLVGFDFEALDDHILVARDRLDMHMVRQGLKTVDHKAQQPFESRLHRTANPP